MYYLSNAYVESHMLGTLGLLGDLYVIQHIWKWSLVFLAHYRSAFRLAVTISHNINPLRSCPAYYS